MVKLLRFLNTVTYFARTRDGMTKASSSREDALCRGEALLRLSSPIAAWEGRRFGCLLSRSWAARLSGSHGEARSGAHRRGGGQGRADLSGQCGSPTQGGCHTHPKPFHAGRGGCHRIGCGQEEVRPSFGAASRRTKRSARSGGGSQMPCGCNSATISCAPCCGPRVGRSRRHLCRASIRPHLNRSAAPCTAQTG